MKGISKIEWDSFLEYDSYEVPPQDVVAYSESRSGADILRMYNDQILIKQPHFQRQIVWNSAMQTRFIDSLIKNLPIPSMCFSFDNNSFEMQVIDGLQRIHTIVRFLSGDNGWTLSNLPDIDPELRGKKANEFADRSSNLFRYYQRVANIVLPVTVIRCDYTRDDHTNYMFMIFHRLNANSVKLSNQEIRNAIFSGSFNDMLKALNKDVLWNKLNELSPSRQRRYLREEIILRFFAYYDNLDLYNGRLGSFLNIYMKHNRKIEEEEIDRKKTLFNRTVKLIMEKIFIGEPQNLSVSILEALLVGVAKNIDTLESKTHVLIISCYQALKDSPEFSVESLSEGLAAKIKVQERINRAISAFHC